MHKHCIEVTFKFKAEIYREGHNRLYFDIEEYRLSRGLHGLLACIYDTETSSVGMKK